MGSVQVDRRLGRGGREGVSGGRRGEGEAWNVQNENKNVATNSKLQ